MNKTELIIDLGSSAVKVFKRGAGLVLNESALIVIENVNGKQTPRFIGNEAARAAVTNRVQGMQVVEPIKDGVIVHREALSLLLGELFKRITKRTLFKPIISVYALVSCGLGLYDKMHAEEALLKAGASEVLIIESPIATYAATQEKNAFIVDIGAAKTEIAIVGEDGIITGCTVDVAGDAVNQAITDYLCDKYHLRVPKQIVETIKLNACSFLDNDYSYIEVSGKSIIDSEPLDIRLKAQELKAVAKPVIDKIIDVLESVTLLIPENIAVSISERGFFLAGGTAEMAGLGKYIENKTYFKCNVMNEPQIASVKGAQTFFDDKVKLSRALNVPMNE